MDHSPNIRQPYNDEKIVAQLIDEFGDGVTVRYNNQNRVIALRLQADTRELPRTVWQLTELKWLDVSGNRLTSLSEELGQLVALRKLDLTRNRLTELPTALTQLSQLRLLLVRNNALHTLPKEIGLLTELRALDLRGNSIEVLPDSISVLTKLRYLHCVGKENYIPEQIFQLQELRMLGLYGYALEELPQAIFSLSHLWGLHLDSNPSATIPSNIIKLTGLRWLSLSSNRLTILPSWLTQLTKLIYLRLDNNQIATVPSRLDQLTQLKTLSLDNNELTVLPAELGHLNQLESLSVASNQLTELPVELGQLTKLRFLWVDNNELTELPVELGQLTQLRFLSLDNNQLTTLPEELGQLERLEHLSLNRCKLTNMPSCLMQLTHLKYLSLNHNQLTTLPFWLSKLNQIEALFLGNNQLTTLPSWIGQLIYIQFLHLYQNQLKILPEELGLLTRLRYLSLNGNRLITLPPWIGQLTQLYYLLLMSNQLTTLPVELGCLSRLRSLSLGNNQLTTVPVELCQLTRLESLSLDNNQLITLPEGLDLLTQLENLSLSSNELVTLPAELGRLAKLKVLDVSNNKRLKNPPSEIIEQGSEAALEFLRELLLGSQVRYESKLLVVGEGGTGKSSLLRTLRGEGFIQGLDTTHGIEVSSYEIPSHNRTVLPLLLHTWDFGGQEIYHATHQFFLTQHSLYLVVWNARLGVEQGRLDYWLKTIQAHAPGAPVLLVATHIDQRPPDLNYQLYQSTYPQIVDSLSVNNINGDGVEELRDALIDQALELPMMGQLWPSTWIAVEQVLLAQPDHHIAEQLFYEICQEHGALAAQVLGDYLHELGKMLYFRDDDVLRNLVVLKPNWITKAISLVLTDELTREAYGVLSHADLPRIWAHNDNGQPYEPRLYPVFLRLMERFDLSYQIEADEPGEHSTRSLVPQLLPFHPPVDLPLWPEVPPPGLNQVEATYKLDFMPAGIMSWFIVRTHRYTTNMHWREGVLLAYGGHQARVELNPMIREIHIVAWGVQPHNFFSILMHTLDLILERFEGLKIERLVPCICHWERQDPKPCPRAHRYDDLIRRIEHGRMTIECPEFLVDVSVATLLYGIHPSTDQQVMDDIHRGVQILRNDVQQINQQSQLILERLNQQSELIVRNFTRQWNLEMHKLEAECPNTFCLMPGNQRVWNPRDWFTHDYRMYLLCQHPPQPHMQGEGYSLRQPPEWWIQVSPWLKYAIQFLKFGVPLGGALEGVYDPQKAKDIEAQLKLLEQITESIPDLHAREDLRTNVVQGQSEQTEGGALRALHSVLKALDPVEHWADLKKTITPDGNILWLCEEHRKIYEVQPLVL